MDKITINQIPDDVMFDIAKRNNKYIVQCLLDNINALAIVHNSETCFKITGNLIPFFAELVRSKNPQIVSLLFSHDILYQENALLDISCQIIRGRRMDLVDGIASRFKNFPNEHINIKVWSVLLIQAIRMRSLQIIDRLLNSKPDLTRCEKAGFSFLFEVIDSPALSDEEKLSLMQRLVALGADVNAVKKQTGASVAHECAQKADVNILKFLASQNAKFDAADKAGLTMLHYAFAGHKEANIKYVFSKKIQAKTTPLGITVLHSALNGIIDQYDIKIPLKALSLQIDMNPRLPAQGRDWMGQFLEGERTVFFIPSDNRFRTHFAVLFERKILDIYLVRCLLSAGADANALDCSIYGDMTWTRHPLYYLLDEFDGFDVAYGIKALHIISLFIEHGMVESDRFALMPLTFPLKVSHLSNCTNINHIIVSCINALNAQIRKNYETAYSLLLELPGALSTNWRDNISRDDINWIKGFIAHQLGVVSQHRGNFSEAASWYQKAVQANQALSVANELALLAIEWRESLTEENAQFGLWLLLYNQLEKLPAEELTPYTHFKLGHFYLRLKGLNFEKRFELSCKHFGDVLYGPQCDQAQQIQTAEGLKSRLIKY